MPDMLVLQRNKKTGELATHVEIDTAPPPRPSWEGRRLPEPIRTPPGRRDDVDDDDVAWLQETVVDLVHTFDWDPEEVAHVDWNGLLHDIADLA